MKTVLPLFMLLLAPYAFASISARDIQSSCSGGLTVLKVYEVSYTPAMPGHYRFSGYPAHAEFKAVTAFSPESSDCSGFIKKYPQDFSHLSSITISVPAVDQETTSAYAQAALGQKIAVRFTQVFPYSYDGLLPFYPLFHEELLQITGFSGPFTILDELKVDTEKVYGVPALAQLNDAGKLQLAQSIVDFQIQIVQQPGWVVPFTELLTATQPSGDASKKNYADILISLLNGLNPERTGGFFFRFEVGGSDGSEIAEHLNALAVQGFVSAETVQNLSYSFPSLLLIGNPRMSCLPVTVDNLKKDIEMWSKNSLNYQQKAGASEVASSLAQTLNYGVCLDQFHGDADLKSVGQALYQKLNPGQ